MNEYMQNVLAAAKEGAKKYLDEQLDVLQEICNTDCQSKDIEGNKKIISIFQKRVFPHLPITTEYVEEPGIGTHVISRFKPENPEGKIVLFGHLDTVFPKGSAAEHPFHKDGDWVYGLGVADCKGGLIIGCYALRILAENNLLPNWEIEMIFNCDEEIGSPSARKIYEKEAKTDIDYTFAMESARLENGLITSRWGCALFYVDIEGKSAHAGLAYDKGSDANLQLAKIMTNLAAKNDPSKTRYYCFGKIEGGDHGDIVSDKAKAEGTFIFQTPEDYEEICRTIKNVETEDIIPGCSVKTDVYMMFPAMPCDEKTLKVYDLVHEAGMILDHDYPQQGSFGSSDANWFTHFGVPSLCALGPYMLDIHTVNERAKIESFVEKTELFTVTLGLLNGRKK